MAYLRKVPIVNVRSLLAAVPLVLLAACGFEVQTDQVYQPSEGVIDRSGDVAILNALIVSGEDGVGALVATLVNTGEDADALTAVASDEAQTGVTEVPLPSNTHVDLAPTGAVAIMGDNVKAGFWVRATLQFANGQQVELNLPVVAADGDFANVVLPDGSQDEGVEQEATAEEAAHDDAAAQDEETESH